MSELFDRIVADKTVDEAAWFEARRQGITATEVAKLAKVKSANTEMLKEKRSGIRSFFGSPATQWGLDREPILVDQVLAPQGFIGSDKTFHAVENRRHLATPDGLYLKDGLIEVAEIKTSKYDLSPDGDYFAKTSYYDQMQFQMYVLGDECDACLYVWETHEDYVPKPAKQEWIQRDQKRINELIVIADGFLEELDGEAPTVDAGKYVPWISMHNEARRLRDEQAARMLELEELIRKEIGDLEQFSLETEFGKISYSTPKPTERFDSAAFKKLQPDVYQEFVRTTQSKSSLRITPVKDATDDVF